MQEEVESRTTNLMISVTKLTARALYTAYVKHRQKAQSRKQAARDAPHSGKQTVKQLIRQNQGVSSMEVSNSDLKGFERIARKYGPEAAQISCVLQGKGCGRPVRGIQGVHGFRDEEKAS